LEAKTKQVLYAMRGGETERVHTIPHLNSYSVAQHSYGVLSLLLILHPNPSLGLIRTTLWHDATEHYTGDMPAHAKWDFPDLKAAMKTTEEALSKNMGMGEEYLLSPQDQRWLKSCDLLELWLWSRAQIRLGNTRARIIMARIETFFGSLVPEAYEVWRELYREDGDYGKEDDDDRYFANGA